MLSAAGCEVKTDLTGTIDGLDLTPLFTDTDYNLDRDKLCWLRYPWLIHYRKDMDKNRGPVGSILKGDWKLIEFLPTPHGLTHHFELYNVRHDPSEQNDFARQMPDKVEELKKEMYKWREEVDAPAYSEAYKEYEKI
jgi:arylsulfatase A-like enzyme